MPAKAPSVIRGLYAIVNAPDPFGHGIAPLTQALVAGAGTLQLRAKQASTAQRIAMLRVMAPICAEAGVTLFVNDDVEAALGGPPGIGLHVGQGDPGADDLGALRARAAAAGRPGLLLGLSTHNKTQLLEGCQQRPDYVALGPIAPTQTKANPDPVVGFAGLLEACRLSTRPLVAIGGLDVERGETAIELGASAVAMIGALQRERLEDVSQAARAAGARFSAAQAPLPFAQVCEAIPVFAPEQLADIAKWSDDLSMHIGLGLPARFAPSFVDGEPRYRPSDLLDLLFVMDKRPAESWEAWGERVERSEVDGALVQLRSREDRQASRAQR